MTDIWPVFWLALAFVVATAAALVARALVLAALTRWQAAEPATVLAKSIRGPSLVWCVAIGLYAATDVALDRALLPGLWHARIEMLLEAALVLSGTVALAGIVAHAVVQVSERSALGAGVTGLAQTTSRVVVFAVGLLVLLSALGLQITPVLTALGVGGLAVALALQDTLANLFAGLHLLADKPIRVGDYVKIADGAEGFVVDIGWRSTRVRSLANNIVVIPNQTVAKATVTNYSQPEAHLSFGFKVCVDYSVDADRVESILRDELTRAVGAVPGLLSEPAPGVSLIPGFGEWALEFGVGYSVASFVQQYQAQHELRKRILQRFRREGIDIAIPTRNIRVRPDGTRAAAGVADGDGAASRPGTPQEVTIMGIKAPTLDGVVADLAKRGFTEHFTVADKRLHAEGSGKSYAPQDVTIRDHFRFEGVSDPGDMSIVYAIETRDGTRGTLVDAFGVYADPAVGEFVKEVAIDQKTDAA